MLFSGHPRTHYEKAPAHEVICQLRFPTILTINNVEPADFQEAIREEFPQYARRQDVSAPKVTGLGGPNPKVEQQPPVTNYNFLSADGQWKLNLTKGCPPAGQAPGRLHQAVQACLFPAGRAAVCQHLLPSAAGDRGRKVGGPDRTRLHRPPLRAGRDRGKLPQLRQ